MDIDGTGDADENSGAAADLQNNARNNDSDKTKGKCKLYVGSQSLGYRRDYMEVFEISARLGFS